MGCKEKIFLDDLITLLKKASLFRVIDDSNHPNLIHFLILSPKNAENNNISY